MNDIIVNIIGVVVSAIVIPLITVLGTRLVSWINTKIKDEKTRTILTEASNIILNAVKSVFQTYVESLKKSGTFDEASQRLAFEKAKLIAITELSENTKTYIKENYGDLNEWLSVQIEASINTIKNLR